MKKVELITLQRVPNYGSVLQCYATQKTIEKLGFECEAIDYRPKRMRISGMLKNIKKKKEIFKRSFILRTLARIIIFPSYIKRFHTFNKFLNNYIKMTTKTYFTNEELINDTIEADMFCTGSDQVWNSDWNEGIDKALFLDFVNENIRKIAYAASFGKKELNREEIDETRKLLERYEKISLRESSGVEIVNRLGLKATNVLDPTLLLTGNEWKKIESTKYKNDDYILVYNLNRNKKIDKYAENLSRKTGLKIRFLSYQLHEFYKKGKISCNPCVEDFLSLIDNAKYVITDSFHATAFSINFNTEFIIVYPEKFSTRLQSLLKINNLENRVAKDEEDLSVIENKIDYKKVNEIMKNEREKSINWLKGALE